MADYKSVISTVEGEQHVIFAALHIVRALGTHKNLEDDLKKILADLDIRLSAMTVTSEKKEGGLSDIKKWINSVEEKVISWVSDKSATLNCSLEEASKYLEVVDEVLKLTESLGSVSMNEDKKGTKLLCRAHSILHMSMARLEEEFSLILFQNRQFFQPEQSSFFICEDVTDEESITSVEGSFREDSRRNVSKEFIIDLVRPDVIPVLKCIANLMFASKYDQECSLAYIRIRKDALFEVLFILEVESMSIEEVLKKEWSSLDLMIKKWIQAIKIFVQVYLASEKQLCYEIFKDLGSVKSDCFTEISKSSVLQLLNFVEAISIGPQQPEKLFRILDMYEVLADLLPNVNALFSNDVGSFVMIEYHEVLKRLSKCVKRTFLKFENAIRWETSTKPFAQGGIHHLTKYVMNYINFLIEYGDTLNLLLEELDEEDHVTSFPNMNPIQEQNQVESSSDSVPPMAYHLQLITSFLESNLQSKAKLYKDISLQHFFLMNNIFYMVQKIKDSDLRIIFGDEWIRKNNAKFQKHAMDYERATWNSIVSLLKDEGICNPGSSSVSKTVLRDRFRSFNLAFEEVYKSQTGWLIQDLQLRDDLRISVSLKVIQAYRTFVGRHANQLEVGRQFGKCIKYSSDDLLNYLLDLFEGSPRSLH
ncbi:Exocyst complex protein Exo70 [Macleaya cordata]|uniref:Exocyst subunit Exo70 family protein n=1 Tax=Macleaya cordata TaxID=56857 RepID=A0A200PVF4_MACCD|nr:Exocyst complex protein Exo70 [Macleaya cordata]